MKSGLTAFELEIQEIDQILEMSLKERQKLESLIKSTKTNRKQKESKEDMNARKNLENLNRYVSQLSQQRRQVIQDMHTYEFLLWANDEKPGYWG